MSAEALRDELVGDEGACTGHQHMPGVVVHQGIGQNMKVTEHFIRTPSADEVNDIRVNLCKQEGCCPCRTKTPSGNVRWEEAKLRAQRRDRGVDAGSKV